MTLKIFKRKSANDDMWLYKCYVINNSTLFGINSDLQVEQFITYTPTMKELLDCHDRVFYDELSPNSDEYKMVQMLIL